NTVDCSEMTPDDYRTKLHDELMNGGGPDVMLIFNDGNENRDYLPDLMKMIRNDVFLDVNSLYIDFSACNQTVMKAGIYEGKQILVPLNYGLGMLYTTEERMAEAGIEYREGMTLAEFAEPFGEFYENNPTKKAFINYLTSQFVFPHSAAAYIDYENSSFMDAAEGLGLMNQHIEAFDLLFPGIFDDSETLTSYMFYRNLKNYGSSDRDIYKSGDLIFMSGRNFDGSYENITALNSLYAEDIAKGETPVVFPLPTLTGEAPAPHITYALVVNANTKNKRAVERFIEYAVSEENLKTSGAAGMYINDDLMEHRKEFYLTKGIDKNDPYPLPKFCEFDPEFVESYFDMIDNMSDPIPFIDRTVSGYMFSLIRNGSINGELTEEDYNAVKAEIEAYLAG
ncbi:MAG: carbohydrate ABC transporter substrate-binding protein, partial [Clostridia bacterium]|nr:carbohydrate ABC transporter substrate-binding protein [Clostridia bacterium]